MTHFDPYGPTRPLPEGSQPNTIQNARPDDPAGTLLAQARVHGSLFGSDSPRARFGRFRVLERLGAGAMGVVYAAYDPDLDRGVALKLVNVPSKDRQAALAEAKSLARLSHPNVVPIYDVGTADDHLYLVMELVRGETLRHWIVGRSTRDILEVYQQAGAALAAAHAAGLVHRDFKPDNAVVGADGRVRVVDFGLACEADDPALAVDRPAAGTPHFMAPEIAAGAAVTPAADQYSFCVALHDALASVPGAPMPRTVLAILERGRAADPAARFASMAQLLRALTRATTRRRRRIAAVVGVAGVLGTVAFLAGQRAPHGEPPVDRLAVCDVGASELATTWAPGARTAALTRIAGLGSYGPVVAPQLERELTAHGQRWIDAYRGACRDRLRGAETESLSDRRAACIQRSREAFGKLGELLTNASPDHLVDLARATRSLPDPVRCSDIAALVSDVAAPPRALAGSAAQLRTELTRARVDLDAGRHGEARDAARRAVATARGLGYAPVLAEALLLEGHAQSQIASSANDRAAATPLLTEAISVAIAERADPVAIEAWARRAWIVGTSSNPAHALDGLEVIAPLAGRTLSATFATALLYNNLGSVELARSERAAARRAFEQAQRLAHGFTGDGALELVVIRANLGLVTDDRRAGDQLMLSAQADRARLLGNEHPDTLSVKKFRGAVTVENLKDAEALLTPACAAYELHPTLAHDASSCWAEVGWVRMSLGASEAARTAMQRSARMTDDNRLAVAYATLLGGDAQTAARQFTDALAALRPSDRWWFQLERAERLLGLGRAQRAMHAWPQARRTLQKAVAALEPVFRDHPAASVERRLGLARVELAFTLAALGASSRELAGLATEAHRWLERVGGDLADLARLDPLRGP
jgi:tetratricopeptide (TPR) repeat protein/predicted Ser/Thr protein kinase